MSRREGGHDGTADGQGALADRIPRGVPRRGELRGVFVRTALAGRLRLPGVREWSRGGAEEPGVHLRMLRLRPADLDHGEHSAAPHQAAADGLVGAAHLMSTHSNGMSARQLEDQLGLTYRTAWLLTQKLRRSM